MMINVIIITIFILPWLIIPSSTIPDPTRMIKAFTFDFAMMIIIAMTIINGLKFEYKNKYLGWIALAIFFGFGFNWYYPLIMGFGYNAGTIEPHIHFLLALVATFCICSNIERNDFVRISKAVVCSATLVASFALLQVVGLDPMKKIATYNKTELRHACALLDHPNVLGNYLALSIPFFMYLFKPKYIVPLLIVVLALFFAHSSLSILAAVIAALTFLILRYRNSKIWKIVLGVVLVGLIVLCFNPKFNKTGDGFTGRIPAWGMILDRADNPIFGQGLGIVKSYGVMFGNNHWMFAHNDYIEMYCAGGVVLLVLFLLLVINCFRKFNYREDNVLGFSYLASFVAFLILMFGSFPMEIAPLALGGLISFWGVSKLA